MNVIAISLANLGTTVGAIVVVVTGIGGLIGAIGVAFLNARTAIQNAIELQGEIKTMRERLDDHSRRISATSEQVTRVALATPVPNAPAPDGGFRVH